MQNGITNGQIWKTAEKEPTRREIITKWMIRNGYTDDEMEIVIKDCEKSKDIRSLYIRLSTEG